MVNTTLLVLGIIFVIAGFVSLIYPLVFFGFILFLVSLFSGRKNQRQKTQKVEQITKPQTSYNQTISQETKQEFQVLMQQPSSQSEQSFSLIPSLFPNPILPPVSLTQQTQEQTKIQETKQETNELMELLVLFLILSSSRR